MSRGSTRGVFYSGLAVFGLAMLSATVLPVGSRASDSDETQPLPAATLQQYLSKHAAEPATAGTLAVPFGGQNDNNTLTPIKHVIIIIGENRSFDHLFATYQPKSGQSVLNLLSEGIINVDGTPGPRFTAALQNQASDTTTFAISPTITGPYATLPPPNTGGTHEKPSNLLPPPFATVAAAGNADYGLPSWALVMLTVGASGLPNGSIDTRIAGANALASGPFQMSPGISTDAYSNDPVHRFYQMWQQSDCSVAYATTANPAGCRMDLFPWVAVTAGPGTRDKPPPSPFTDESTKEGAISMGFYNMAEGNAAVFNDLAQHFTLGDNFHQSVMGGTVVDHIMLGAGDVYWYSDGNGNPITPPAGQIFNPNPQPGTNNWYTEDGYATTDYTECSDPTQPGVAPIVDYLASLPYHPSPNCLPGYYYMVDNQQPSYLGDGTLLPPSSSLTPPTSTPTIADVLLAAGVSWTYFGEGWNAYLKNPAGNSGSGVYWPFANPFQYETSIMTNAAVRTNDLQDTTALYTDIANNTLPAVSFVKPGRYNNAHPQGSKPDLLGAFLEKLLREIQANAALSQSTAIFITFDEGGGYYDSGPIQPLDFFGDGPRIPLIVVSAYSTGGQVVHSYSDHVSILKFIEKNWNLPTISNRSRDNLPNPVAATGNAYFPANPPAIDDLMDFFHF